MERSRVRSPLRPGHDLSGQVRTSPDSPVSPKNDRRSSSLNFTTHMVLKRDKRSPEKHICGEYFCQNCKEYVIGRHLCYQRYCEPKSQDVNFVFFDFECRQDAIAQCSLGYLKPSRCSITCKDEKLCKKCSLCMNCRESWCGKYKHLPNFAVAQTVCDKCVENPLTRNSKYVKCGSRCDKCNVL